MSDPYRQRLEDQHLDFTVEREERLCDGFRPLDSVTVRHAPLGRDAWLTARREFLRSGHAAIVIPYDPARDEIVVIRQFRIGAAMTSGKAAALELPAGLVDAGEAPLLAARRELEEETGLVASAIAPCFTALSSPGLCDEVATYFLALVDAGALNGRGGKLDEQEDIIAVRAPVDALIEAVDSGSVENGFLITAAHWFARHGRARAQLLQDAA
ncbi:MULTISPECIES: NUDIX domain-containing protein [unclassified Aureimonas]|uniref:NUDIX domain-containing protein n=1 Tax=unclassified Aureimonas TaxID=2615206 RepID=UPI000720ED0C|nr:MULTISPECIES: NUDIX hydrolase [unclassified Aureimonas]ALN71967.1 hypothetical protein M673_04520 [Aureimonas sp. AU20]